MDILFQESIPEFQFYLSAGISLPFRTVAHSEYVAR